MERKTRKAFLCVHEKWNETREGKQSKYEFNVFIHIQRKTEKKLKTIMNFSQVEFNVKYEEIHLKIRQEKNLAFD